MLKLEVGKRYRRQDGIVTEPLVESGNSTFPFYDPQHRTAYTATGKFFPDGEDHSSDLIEDAVDEPVTIEPGKESTLPDSGDRTNFSTGAVRDAASNKGLPSLIPPQAIIRLAKRFEDGATKYSRNNWMKGIPLSRFQDAIQRHLLAAAEGKTDEDHLGAVLWNAAAWIWTEDEIAAGRLPAELDDLPYREHRRAE